LRVPNDFQLLLGVLAFDSYSCLLFSEYFINEEAFDGILIKAVFGLINFFYFSSSKLSF